MDGRKDDLYIRKYGAKAKRRAGEANRRRAGQAAQEKTAAGEKTGRPSFRRAYRNNICHSVLSVLLLSKTAVSEYLS